MASDPGRGERRVILHADMDAFYASVEQRDRPELRGRPVVVGGPPPRGVVSAASYEARAFGIRSAMPSIEAQRLCKDAIFLRGDMKKYGRESRRIRSIFEAFTPDVEPLSLDEAYLDLTHTLRALAGTPLQIGRRLREQVRTETGLAVSVGIGPSKLVAKTASDLAKPDGLLEVAPEAVAAFLAPLPVWRLPGVGTVAGEGLRALGLETVGQVAALDDRQIDALARAARAGRTVRAVRQVAGSLAELRELARGHDARRVDAHREARSYGEENTFSDDVTDTEILHTAIVQHADAVARRMRRDGVRGSVVRLRVKTTERLARAGQYRLLSRQRTLGEPTDDGATIARVARELLADGHLPLPVRLLGVTVAGIDEGTGAVQLTLFASSSSGRASSALNAALDRISARFGETAVRRGVGGIEKAAPSLGIKRGEEP